MTFSAKYDWGRLINRHLVRIMQIAAQMHHRAAFDGSDGWEMPRRTSDLLT